MYLAFEMDLALKYPLRPRPRPIQSKLDSRHEGWAHKSKHGDAFSFICYHSFIIIYQAVAYDSPRPVFVDKENDGPRLGLRGEHVDDGVELRLLGRSLDLERTNQRRFKQCMKRDKE